MFSLLNDIALAEVYSDAALYQSAGAVELAANIEALSDKVFELAAKHDALTAEKLSLDEQLAACLKSEKEASTPEEKAKISINCSKLAMARQKLVTDRANVAEEANDIAMLQLRTGIIRQGENDNSQASSAVAKDTEASYEIPALDENGKTVTIVVETGPTKEAKEKLAQAFSNSKEAQSKADAANQKTMEALKKISENLQSTGVSSLVSSDETSKTIQNSYEDYIPNKSESKGIPWLAVLAVVLGATKAVPTAAAVGLGAVGLWVNGKINE